MRLRPAIPILGVLCLASAVVWSQPAPAARGAAQDSAAPVSAAPVTFAGAIAPIVYDNCVSCHRPGEAAPFPLISYEDVAKRGALVAQVTRSRYMPPWHAAPGHGEFVGERRLTEAQIAAIGAWVQQGMPRGDMSRMPALPSFPADGWLLGQPDLVLEMPAGFDLPASGPDVFRNFVIPTGLTEDKWVRAVEYRPSARQVVHHAIFAHAPARSLASLDGADGRPGFGGMGTVGVASNQESRGLGGWAVGATPVMLPDGVALRLPAGADFLLQVHFHLSGKAETEKSVIGLHFADKAPEKDLFSVELPALFAFGAGLDIPPGEKQYTIRDSFTLPGDVRVFLANAHAHYLAREMKATATLPDGSTRPLLWIPDWDFNWQDSYIYKDSFVLPKRTRLDAVLTYDNSADNPRNPVSPPRRVLWGEQSFDEMGAVGLMFEVLNKEDVPAVRQALAERGKLAIAAAGKNGTLARFLARANRERAGLQQLTVFDRSGAVVTRIGEPGLFAQAAFSPDGSRLAVVKVEPATDVSDVWTFDIATGRGRAITIDDAADSAPVWSPDGRRIAYVSNRGNTPAVYARPSDGSGAEQRLYQHDSGAPIVLTDWSADGRYLTFWQGDAMFLLPASGSGGPVALGQDFFGRGGRFSPDGRYLAWSAKLQVFVRGLDLSALPGGAPRPAGTTQQVSTSPSIGGIFWRRDGRELFYLSILQGQFVTAVDVNADGTAGPPRRLFQLPGQVGAPAQLSSVATADGQRFAFAVNVRR